MKIKFLGFLDIKPLTRGNSLLIPKEHHKWVIDVPNFGDYFEAAKKVARASEKVLNTESISLLTLGYEVPHAHIRIIPRYPDDLHPTGIDTKVDVKTPKEEMLKIAEGNFMPDESNLEQQLILINKKLDRITNPFKVAGLQFTAGIFHSFGNLVGTILVAAIVYYIFSSLNLGEYLNQYIQNLIPKPQINIQSPF